MIASRDNRRPLHVDIDPLCTGCVFYTQFFFCMQQRRLGVGGEEDGISLAPAETCRSFSLLGSNLKLVKVDPWRFLLLSLPQKQKAEQPQIDSKNHKNHLPTSRADTHNPEAQQQQQHWTLEDHHQQGERAALPNNTGGLSVAVREFDIAHHGASCCLGHAVVP